MGILILLAILAGTFFVVGLVAQKLSDFVRGDGATERGWTRTPPRSHHVDQFDPRSHAA
jgi:hypothetical protein